MGGQTSSALTLGQIYHPISHIAASLPGYWEGKALEWINLLRLLSLGVAQFILIQATGYCHLAMDEIEVYPQDHNTSKRKFNDDQILK